MPQILKYLPAPALMLCFAASLPLSAQSQAKASEAQVISAAHKSAQLAGGARFCKADPDSIEEFISISYARINVLAKDDYERVIGRLEFKNMLAAFSAKDPEGGCDSLIATFKAVLRNTN